MIEIIKWIHFLWKNQADEIFLKRVVAKQKVNSQTMDTLGLKIDTLRRHPFMNFYFHKAHDLHFALRPLNSLKRAV